MGHAIKVTFLFIGTIFISYVQSYPNSVPNSPDVCSKMIPGHGPRPQSNSSPYEILLNKFKVQGGNNLQIVLQGKNGEKFRGFYIQARDQDGSPIGSFQSDDPNEAWAHSCFNIKNNAIHHRNRNDKASVTVYWKAPEDYQGQVKVIGTVVQDFETFWSNIQAPKSVSVSINAESNKSFLEKRKKTTTEDTQKARILNYNPYSPYSPLASWESNHTSSEFLQTQPSDEYNNIEFRKRQLFGNPNFDFHGGLYASKLPAIKPKVIPPSVTHNPNEFPGIQPQKFPLHGPPHFNHPHFHLPLPEPLHNKVVGNLVSHRHPAHHPIIAEKHLPYNYPPIEDPYYAFHHSLSSPLEIGKQHGIGPFEKHGQWQSQQPQHQLLPASELGNKEFIYDNHIPINKPIRNNFHKPAADPSYDSIAGYYPKDLLTKLTSYIPNVYNALSNNPLFNFVKEHPIESIWRPSKGYDYPVKEDTPFLASSTKHPMPKYGYLVYNPVRGDPYFVIPAKDENEFVAKFLQRGNQI